MQIARRSRGQLGETTPGERYRGSTRFDRFSALVVLTALGITWPVLDLLGRNAEFFLARRSPKTEIVVLALIATLVIPALIGLTGILPGQAGKWVAAGLITVSATSLARLYLARTELPDWVTIAVAAVVSVAATWAFFRSSQIRQGFRYLLPAPLLLLAVFLFTMPVGEVLREPDTAVGNPVTVRNPVPILIVIFDQLPVASLIDPHGDLREDRYPNFARLAADGIWFSNAMTVEQQTEHSVPAILTGSVPDQALSPLTGQYPFNLFTSLRSGYDMRVYESITQLCPRQLCGDGTRTETSLSSDVGVVAGHVLLPEQLADELPPIDRGWGEFQNPTVDVDVGTEFRELMKQGRRVPVDGILDDISQEVGAQPPLYYLHALIPHRPWEYLPDGRKYPLLVPVDPATDKWSYRNDEFLVAQAMQGHLLQVGYTDHILGELITALEQAGLYDDSLIVVTADHGIAIKPGVDHMQEITDTSVGEVAAIPLMVKLPNADERLVDDRRALTIDILPTIADVIDADLPGDVDGVSLLGPSPNRQDTTTIGPTGSATYGIVGDEKLAVAERIESWFPDGDPWVLRPEGSPDLVGVAVDVDALEPSSIVGQIREEELYLDVESSAPVIPARIGAILSGDVDGSEFVAVAVNGTIGAVTRSYVLDGEVALLAMVEPHNFVDGANRVDLLEISSDGELMLIGSQG